MTTYAIGDIQGCFDEFQALLDVIGFMPEKDTLWLAGDLVNRGPKSLEVLRFVVKLPNVISVLGNHDLHLMALASGLFPEFEKHTLSDVLDAPDCDSLLGWLRHRPLLHHDSKLGFTLIHAGLPAAWNLFQAQQYAAEAESLLRNDKTYEAALKEMYGNKPDRWDDALASWGRLRFITNCFTRMRYVNLDGTLDFKYTGAIGSQAEGLIPWFDAPHRATRHEHVIFGHWASLRGQTNNPYAHALDGGCVWGNELVAMRLEDRQRFTVPAANAPG